VRPYLTHKGLAGKSALTYFNKVLVKSFLTLTPDVRGSAAGGNAGDEEAETHGGLVARKDEAETEREQWHDDELA
jgi:hypothetical protein